MSNKILLDYGELNLNNINYQVPTKNKMGSYVGNIMYDTKKNCELYIQTPTLKCHNPLIMNTRNFLECELDEKNPEHVAFYNFITNLDEKNISLSHKNFKQWN